MKLSTRISCASLVTLICSPGAAAPASVAVPAFELPPSNQLSDAAKAVLLKMRSVVNPDFKGDIVRQRAFYQKYNDDRLAEMQRSFRTDVRHTRMGNVGVDVVTPAKGVSPRNAERVLINVHGGAFMWGSGSGALVEAIPIAATAGIKVVTVDYRLAPEHHYPAASQDVAAVYRALLDHYRPENIGIYGCSAGGIISAQSIGWIRQQGLPRPGAIGTFCGTGAAYSGDSVYLSGPITSGEVPPAPPLPDTLPAPYMSGIPAEDKIAYPLSSDGGSAEMPPTLLLAGGRDFAASGLTLAHRQLAHVGVTSELYLFDGLPHPFFVWPQMPESIEAYQLIARFFNRSLGTKPR